MKPSDPAFRKIRLRQLRCFVTVARRKSFVLASEELGLTQPAVSRSVRELEQILDTTLFDRTTRGAELTSLGRGFLEAAEAGLNQIWHGTQSLLNDETSHEVVRIGALPNVCSQFLPRVLVRYQQETNGIRVEVTPGTNRELLGALRRGETDLVLGRLSSSEDMRGLSFEALFDEPLIFVVSQSHPLAHSQVTVEDTVRFPLVVPPEGTIIRAELDRYLAANGINSLVERVETTSSDLIRAYVRLSNAVAITPRGVVQDDLETGALVQLDLDDKAMSGPVGLTSNPQTRSSNAVERFLAVVRTALDTKNGM